MKRTTFFVIALLATITIVAQDWSAVAKKAANDKNFASAAVAVLLDSTGVSVTDNG